MAEHLISLRIPRMGSEAMVPPEIVELLEQCLEALTSPPVKSLSLKTEEHLESLTQLRQTLNDGATDPATWQRTAREILRRHGDYTQRSRAYLKERENEYLDLIRLLQEATLRLAGENSTFHTRLLSTSERFRNLGEISDIRQLKQKISQEVEQLRALVADKHKQDDDTYTQLSRRISHLESSLETARHEAAIDPLTEAANRRTFDQTLMEWVEAARTHGKAFVLALLDLDDFKRINDNHGHLVGDGVLRWAVAMIKGQIRSSDLLARFGGEEFAILLDNVKLVQAGKRVREVLERVEAGVFLYESGSRVIPVRITLSAGLTEHVPGDTVEDMVQRADDALYQAKERGKNSLVSRGKTLGTHFLNGF